MRLLRTFYLLLLSLPVQASNPTPESTLHAFYSWVLNNQTSSLPSSKQRTNLAMVLSPALLKLLEEASDTEALCLKVVHEGEKPNIFEGDLFVGNYEGATEVTYGKITRDGDAILVEANLVYVDTRFPKAHQYRTVAWKDVVELREIGASWLVQDVRFDRNASLTSILQKYVTEGAGSCLSPSTSLKRDSP